MITQASPLGILDLSFFYQQGSSKISTSRASHHYAFYREADMDYTFDTNLIVFKTNKLFETLST